MAPAIGLHAVAQYSTLRIADSLVEGTLVALFAALILRARGQSAGTRFAVWFSALAAIATFPFITGGWLSHRAMSSAISRAAVTLPDSWAIYVFAAWALIAFISLIGVGRALWHLHAIRRACSAIDPASLPPVLQATLHSSRRCPVTLAVSQALRVPTALGLFDPMIVFPQWALKELSPDDLNQILLHELAHLNRWDDWTNLIQQIVRALFFFHPAVWWIERKVALDREMACDDAVLAQTASPRAYAECLANLAEKSFLERSVALAQAALGRVHQTSLRVAEILNGTRTPRAGSWKPAVSIVATFTIACAAFAARSPELIAFQDTSNNTIEASNAAYPTPSLTAPVPTFAAMERSFTPRVIQAKLNTDQPVKKLRPRAAIRLTTPKTHTAGMVHLASIDAAPSSLTPSVPVTETLFFVIETQDSVSPDHSFVNVQMWRVTVFRQTVHTDQAPRKTT